MTTTHANDAEQALTRLAHGVRLDGRRILTDVVRFRTKDPHDDRFVVEAGSPPLVV
jgi:hypothetical protein